jgi:hypothetical protein
MTLGQTRPPAMSELLTPTPRSDVAPRLPYLTWIPRPMEPTVLVMNEDVI